MRKPYGHKLTSYDYSVLLLLLFYVYVLLVLYLGSIALNNNEPVPEFIWQRDKNTFVTCTHTKYNVIVK